jgi:hypothetical protein
MPIQYMLAVDGKLSCNAPPWNTSHSLAACAPWDARADRLQRMGVPTVPTITLPPGYVGTGVQLLLSSAKLQTAFISAAVRTCQAKNHSGLAIDFENSGGHSTADLVSFLTKLTAGLHASGRTLACAFNDGWLDPRALQSAGLDRLQDMYTYPEQASWDKALIRSRMAAVGGAEKYCLGLDPSLPPVMLLHAPEPQARIACFGHSRVSTRACRPSY